MRSSFEAMYEESRTLAMLDEPARQPDPPCRREYALAAALAVAIPAIIALPL